MTKSQENQYVAGAVPLVPSVPHKNNQSRNAMDEIDAFEWVPDPSRPPARELTDAEVDAMCAEWRARNPDRV